MVYLAPLWRHPGILMEAGPRRYGHQWYNNTWYSFLHWQKYNFEHYGALQGQFVLYLVSQGDKMVQLQSRKYVEVSWLLPPDTISPSWALPHTCFLQPYHSPFAPLPYQIFQLYESIFESLSFSPWHAKCASMLCSIWNWVGNKRKISSSDICGRIFLPQFQGTVSSRLASKYGKLSKIGQMWQVILLGHGLHIYIHRLAAS